MAENKKSFVLYADFLNVVEKLPDEVAGKLFKIILLYVNDKNPKVDDLLLNIAFEPIKLQLKRDLVKYEEVKETKSQGGQVGNLKRWHSDLYDKFIKKEISLKEALDIAKSRIASHTDVDPSHSVAKIAVNDNVNVTVNDNVTDTVIKDNNRAKTKFSPPTHLEVSEYFNEKINDTFWSESEANYQAEKFINFYTSKNWMVGKNKMTIWKSAAAGWVLRSIENQTNNGKTKNNTSTLKSNNGTAAPKDFGQL